MNIPNFDMFPNLSRLSLGELSMIAQSTTNESLRCSAVTRMQVIQETGAKELELLKNSPHSKLLEKSQKTSKTNLELISKLLKKEE